MMLGILLPLLLAALFRAEDDFLPWDARQAKAIALATRVDGQAGKSLDFRVTGTDRSYNYKLRATWMTPEVIRAVARLQQFASAYRRGDPQAGGGRRDRRRRVILVEIDPREGSGVIPSDWVALLGARPNRGPPRAPCAASAPRGCATSRRWPAARGAITPMRFSGWCSRPGEDGQPLFSRRQRGRTVTVRIHGKEGECAGRFPTTFAENHEELVCGESHRSMRADSVRRRAAGVRPSQRHRRAAHRAHAGAGAGGLRRGGFAELSRPDTPVTLPVSLQERE